MPQQKKKLSKSAKAALKILEDSKLLKDSKTINESKVSQENRSLGAMPKMSSPNKMRPAKKRG